MEETLKSLEATMDFGATFHEPGSWLTEGLEHHMQHAYDHVKEWLLEGNDEDLEHALCRMAMALYSLHHKIHTAEIELDQTIVLVGSEGEEDDG